MPAIPKRRNTDCNIGAGGVLFNIGKKTGIQPSPIIGGKSSPNHWAFGKPLIGQDFIPLPCRLRITRQNTQTPFFKPF